MDGYMYAIMKGSGKILGYLNYGMQREAPAEKDILHMAEIQFKEPGLMAKKVAVATVKDGRLMDEAEHLDCKDWKKVEALISRCETLEAAIRMEYTMRRLERLSRA